MFLVVSKKTLCNLIKVQQKEFEQKKVLEDLEIMLEFVNTNNKIIKASVRKNKVSHFFSKIFNLTLVSEKKIKFSRNRRVKMTFSYT